MSRRTAIATLVLLGLTAWLWACERGTAPPALHLEDLDRRVVDPLREGDAEVRVFVFARSDCPISNRYAPEIRRIADRFDDEGIAFWMVYPDPDEAIPAIRAHLDEFSLELAALRDVKHDLVRWTEAKSTPEVAVIVNGRGVVYHGAIDDRYVNFGQARQEPNTRYLEEVLTAVVEGREVEWQSTKSIGCTIRSLL